MYILKCNFFDYIHTPGHIHRYICRYNYIFVQNGTMEEVGEEKGIIFKACIYIYFLLFYKFFSQEKTRGSKKKKYAFF